MCDRDLDVLDLDITSARPDERRQGLLYFIAFTLGGLRIDGVTLRRTRSGDLTLSFPKRRDQRGREWSIVRPTTPDARRELTEQVLAKIDLEGLLRSAPTCGPGRSHR